MNSRRHGDVEPEYTEVAFDQFVHETANAYLIKIDKKEVWVPKSVVKSFDHQFKQVMIAEWFAVRESLV